MSNLLSIQSAVTGTSIDTLVSGYSGRGYGDLKKDTADAVVAYVTPIKRRVDELSPTPPSSPRPWPGRRPCPRGVGEDPRRVYDRLGFLPSSQ